MRAHIVHFGTQMTWRGGEAQMMLLAGGTRLHDYSVSFVARPGSELARRARSAGFEVDELGFAWHYSPLAARRLGAILRERRARIIHLHDGHSVWLGKTAAWLAGTPHVVATRRVDFPVRSSRKWSSGIDRVVAISECIARVLREAGIPDEKLRVVHSGIDTGRLASAAPREKFRAELGLGEWAPLVVTVGALTDHKGQRYLVDAMPAVREAHPSAHLVIAGEGELRSELTAQVERLGLSEWVHLVGFRPDVPGILAAAEVAVFPSHLEGLCTSAMDAMACGLSVVATDAGGLPEVVAAGETGLVVPARDPGALSEALIGLLGDEDRRRGFGEAGRERVAGHFTAERMVEGNLAVYEELLGSRRGGAEPGEGGEA